MPKRRELISPAEIKNAIRSARQGVVIRLGSLNDLAATTEERVDLVKQVFARGASIQVDEVIVGPDQADILLLGMRSRKRRVKDPKKMGGHNRVPDDERAKALPFWQDETLSVAQLEKFTGRSVNTLRRWFQDEHPRNPKRGRPRQK